MFVQMKTSELEDAIAINQDDLMPLESMGFVWGRFNLLDDGASAHDSSPEDSYAKGKREKGINGTAELTAAAAAPESAGDEQNVHKAFFMTKLMNESVENKKKTAVSRKMCPASRAFTSASNKPYWGNLI